MFSVTSNLAHNLIPLAVTSTIEFNIRTKHLTTLDTTDYISAVSSKTIKVSFNAYKDMKQSIGIALKLAWSM